jgi:uncharacterized SAM-binding protein YcdF (DUF218 family)
VSEPWFRKRQWLIPAGVFLGLLVVGTVVFLNLARWFVVEDPLGHADAIVVLSGHMPERALEAARLFQAGYAEQIWISQPDSPQQALKQMKIVYLGEDFYNEKVLLAQKIPLDDVHILEHAVANTEEEVREVAKEMQRTKVHNVILVTSKPHTRRVRIVWRKLAGGDLHAIVRYANDDPFDEAHWWRHTQDALDLVRELLGVFNAWAGFPVRPSHT